ncbi:MAG: hypothetical protein ABIR31_04945 [Ginsengibacter sp.]
MKVDFDKVLEVISPKNGGHTGSYSPDNINVGILLTTGLNALAPAPGQEVFKNEQIQ